MRIHFLVAVIVLVFVGHDLDARLVEIRLLHTVDISGQVQSIGKSDSEQTGGLLRLSSAISDLKNDSSNSILSDAGGAFFGTPESDVLSGAILAESMNHIGYDFYVPAEDDFSRGVVVFSKLCRGLEAVKIASNLGRLSSDSAVPDFPKFSLRVFDGVRVAYMGITDPNTPRRIFATSDFGLEWMDPCQSLKETVREVRASNPDILVLVAHQGLLKRENGASQIRRIAAEFPGIDVILGGGTWKSVPEVMLENTLYTQPRSLGRQVAVVDLIFDTVAGKVVSKTAQLVDVDSDIPVDESLLRKIEPELQSAKALLDVQVARSLCNFSPVGQDGEPGVTDLLLRSVESATDADVVILPKMKSGIWKRPQYERDVRRIYRHEDRVAVMSLTLEGILEIMEESLDSSDGSSNLALLGLEMDVGQAAGLAEGKVRLELPSGEHIHPRRRFRVAVNTFMLASAGGRCESVHKLSLDPRSALELKDVLVRDALREYLRLQSPVDYGSIDSDSEHGGEDE